MDDVVGPLSRRRGNVFRRLEATRELARGKDSAMLKRFVREEEGATMVEYGLMIALIAVVLIVIVSLLGQNLKKTFSRTNSGVESAITADASSTAGGAVAAPTP
jgi:pilus assembly protein Flp/PilA